MAKRSTTAGNKGIILVKKANQLIESRYKFDIWETRFFLAVLGQVRREDDEFRVYRIWYRDIIKTFGLKSGDSYAHLRAAANSLMEKSFFVSYETEGAQREVRYHILRKIDYLKEGQEGRVAETQEYLDVTVEQEMKPLLLQLQKNFTAYDLRNVVKLGVYPMRIYELLKQYESIGARTLAVDEVKKMFELSVEYARFPDFNRWVVKPAIREINKHTDLEVASLEYIKEGRRVTALRFVFRKKNREDVPALAAPRTTSNPILYFQNEPTDSVEPPRSAEADPASLPPLLQFSERLFDWWGIQPEAFLKRAEGKSAQDVETAIEFTQTRIRAGKAENPAGVFLEALSKGYIAPEQIKNRKKQEREQQEREKKAALAPLVAAYNEWQEAYTKALNDAIRHITSNNPQATEAAIGRIKASFKNMGLLDVADKSIEDFRESPMLRALVKSEIMKDFPAHFAGVNAEFGAKIGEAKARILGLEPNFRFE